MVRDPFHRSALDGVELFVHLPRRVLRSLAHHTDRVTVPAGTTIAEAGRAARQVVVVLDGWVEEHHDGWVERFGAGTRVGERELAAHEPHSTTWVAATDVEALVVDAPAFRWIAVEHPSALTAA